MNDLRYFQAQIGKWHRATFGENVSRALYQKAQEELAEFLANPSEEEAADVFIVLLAMADRQGWDLMLAVADKFQIVTRRDQRARDAARGIVHGPIASPPASSVSPAPGQSIDSGRTAEGQEDGGA